MLETDNEMNENSAPNTSDENALGFFIKSLWEKRASGLSLPSADVFRNVTSEDVANLLNLYPFLQMVSTTALFVGGMVPSFVKSRSGWTIHDYGDAMSSSLGYDLYKAGEYTDMALLDKLFAENLEAEQRRKTRESNEDKTEQASGEDVNVEAKPLGTIVKQAYDTASEMVEIAYYKGWKGIQIIAGSPVMQWAAWSAAQDYELEVLGFTPDKIAELKRRRVKTVPELLVDRKSVELRGQ
ncbi:MAG: hypothetical protein WCW01_05990 [Gammaproteobacteria bacterium]